MHLTSEPRAMGRRPESPDSDLVGPRPTELPQGASPAEAYGFVGFVLTGACGRVRTMGKWMKI